MPAAPPDPPGTSLGARHSMPGPRHPPSGILSGRIPPAEMFPAGRGDIDVRFVTLASGLRVRVLECGPADGAPVFLLHGWGCSVYSYRHNFAPLARAGLRVLSADLKGHGLSDKPTGRGEYGSEALAEHVVQILDALGVARAALVGHSMGGALALDVAMRAPERVCRVALLASIGLGEAGMIGLLRVLTPAALAPLYPHLVRRWLVSLVLRVAYGRRGAYSARDVDEYWAPTQFREAVQAAREEVHEFVWLPVPPERLRTLRCPVLVVAGTRDRLVDPRSARRVLAALPAARVHLVDGAGHVVQEEAPEEVNRVLVDFLATERAAVECRRPGAA